MSFASQTGQWTLLAPILPVVVDAAAKSALVLIAAGATVCCMRKCSAAARHLVWFLAVASLPLLPVLSLALPGWHILPRWFNVSKPPTLEQRAAPIVEATLPPSPAQSPVNAVAPAEARPEPQEFRPTPVSSGERTEVPFTTPPKVVSPPLPHRPFNLLTIVLPLWLAGAALAFLPTALGLFSLWRLERSSRRETASSWLELLRQLVDRLNFRRAVALLKTNRRRMPMTWGIFRPKLLLPDESRQWTEDRRHVVLLHELAHAKRWDYLTNLVTQFVCALYWFNPLVWFAARQMIAERERACDDIVLRHGARPADYAEQILQIAAGLRLERWAGYGGIAMARPSKLEGRLRAILEENRNRAAVTRTIAAASGVLLAAVVIPMAMIKAQSPATPLPAAGANTARKGNLEELKKFLTSPPPLEYVLYYLTNGPSSEFRPSHPSTRQPAVVTEREWPMSVYEGSWCNGNFWTRRLGPGSTSPLGPVWGAFAGRSGNTSWQVVGSTVIRETVPEREPEFPGPVYSHAARPFREERFLMLLTLGIPSAKAGTFQFDGNRFIVDRDVGPKDHGELLITNGWVTGIRLEWPGSYRYSIFEFTYDRHRDQLPWFYPSEITQKVYDQSGKLRSDGYHAVFLKLQIADREVPASRFVPDGVVVPVDAMNLLAGLAPTNRAYYFLVGADGKLISINSQVSFPGQGAGASFESVGDAEAGLTNARPFIVKGRVTDPQGNGIAGVTITAHCGMGTLFPTGETNTDATGHYTLHFREGMKGFDESSGQWRVALQAATIAPRKAGWFETNLYRGGDLLMADRLPAPSENVGWKLDPTKVVLPNRPYELNFVMQPAARIVGQLSDELERPMARTKIWIDGELPPSSSVLAETETDDEGRFRFEDVPTGYFLNFNIASAAGMTTRFDSPGELALYLRVRESRGSKVLGPVAPPGGTTAIPLAENLQGRLVDDRTGAAITTFWLQRGVLNPMKPLEITWTNSYEGPIVTDSSGRFALHRESAAQTWRILAEGYSPCTVAASQSGELVVRMQPAAELRGVVLDYSGQPVAGARVLLTNVETELSPDAAAVMFENNSATTDRAGRFALRRPAIVDLKGIVVSGDGHMVQPVAISEASQDLTIRLPQQATLIVRYDIPGDTAEAGLGMILRLREMDASLWTGLMPLDYEIRATVRNRGEVVLTNLTPGPYVFIRQKPPAPDRPGQWGPAAEWGPVAEQRRFDLEPGRTQRVDMVRSIGHQIHGRVTGLERAGASSGYVSVRSGERNEISVDMAAFGKDGKFQTALLEPGTYYFSVGVSSDSARTAITNRTERPRLALEYFANTNLTVTADAEPPALILELAPFNITNRMAQLAAMTNRPVSFSAKPPAVPASIQRQIDAQFPPGSRVAGRVVDDDTGEPIVDFVVQRGMTNFSKPDEINWEHYMMGDPRTQTPGAWSVQLDNFVRAVRILAPGHVPQILTRESLANKSTDNLEVRLKRGAALQGTVLDAEGRPVRGAKVYLATVQRVTLMDGKFQYGEFRGDSTTTDESGHFTLRREGDAQQKLVVATTDNHLIWPVVESASDENVKITLPRTGTLVVRYDIPGDTSEARPELQLVTTNKDRALWKDISFGLSLTVSNRGETVLTNLTPGTYSFRRWKSVDHDHGAQTESGIAVVEAGQISHLDLVRTNGQRIRGQLTGQERELESGGYIFVRSPEATGTPWPQASRNEQKEMLLPTYDVLKFGAEGTFETAMLKPGSYTIVAHVYPPQAPAAGFPYHPDYVGVAKITVAADTAPPVTIQLAQAQYVEIGGRVVDDETGASIPDVIIQSGVVNTNKPDEIIWSPGYSGRNPGQFSLRDQRPGAAWWFSANGYLPQTFRRDEVIASRRTADLQVRLKRGGKLQEFRGVVLDHAGWPVPEAEVILASLDSTRPGPPGRDNCPWITTDAAGRFSMRGAEGTPSRLIVKTANGWQALAVYARPHQDLKITLPEPATLIVHYDIPGDVPAANFSLQLRTNGLEMPLWGGVRLNPWARVPNGGQVVLKNLMPGKYDFFRERIGGATNSSFAFLYGDPGKPVQSDRQSLTLESGKTRHVSLVRSIGHRVEGQVKGVETLTNLIGAFLCVGSATAIRDPLDFGRTLEPCFDAVKFDKDGRFQTALLEPGTYTLIAEVFVSGKPPAPRDDEPQWWGWSSAWGFGQLGYVGSAKVTVTAGAAAPAPVKIDLQPYGDRSAAHVRSVTGSVVDAETQRPIDDFTVTPGSPAAYDLLNWQRDRTTRGKSGAYQLSVDYDYAFVPPWLLVEAPGYAPEMAWVPTNRVRSFQLRKGRAVEGTVLDTIGRPVSNAQVIFRTKYSMARLEGAQFHNPFGTNLPNLQHSPEVLSGADGRFSLPATAGAISFLAVHQSGFVEQSFSQLPLGSNTTIRLQPWARVEGTLRQAERPIANGIVHLEQRWDLPGALTNWGFHMPGVQTVSDSSGHFIFEKISPGDFHVFPGDWVTNPSFVRNVKTEAGKTAVVELDVAGPKLASTNRPISNPQSAIGEAVGADGGWGEPVNGLSVRLSAAKPVWDFREPQFLTFSVRNQSKQPVAVARSQVAGELEIDGVWYEWPNPVSVTPARLAPGSEFDNLEVSLSGAGWRKGSTLGTPGPGKHTLRFAVRATADNADHAIRAESNPVDMEFRWAASATNPPVTFVPADLPVIADIRGSVVDDETGAAVTNFWVQHGVANPEKPDDIIWSQSYRGPIITGAKGRFAVQAQRAGQTWRVLADGYLPQLVLEHPVAEGMPSLERVVRLKRGGELHGVVLDHAAHPVAGARVFLASEQTPRLIDGKPANVFSGSSATTDAAGQFTLQGVGSTEPKVIAVSPDGLQVCSAQKIRPGEQLKITLPKPGTLIVRYDIPDDAPEAELNLMLRSSDRQTPDANELKPKVANGSQIVLANLAPGTYEFSRTRMLHGEDGGRGVSYERRTLVIETDQTQRVDLVRSIGHSVQGEVTGFDPTNAFGGYLYVRSENAGGDPRDMSQWLLPCFDALTFGKDGTFHTALLSPGTYTIVAEVYLPETPDIRYENGREVRVWRSGWRLPAYVGASKVTITTNNAPPRVEIDLRAWIPGTGSSPTNGLRSSVVPVAAPGAPVPNPQTAIENNRTTS